MSEVQAHPVPPHGESEVAGTSPRRAREVAGISVDDREITLRIRGGSVLTIPEDVLERIDLEVADPLGNGALIGLGTGIGAAAMMSLGCGGGEFAGCLAW